MSERNMSERFNKLTRAKTLAVKCSQRLDPEVAQRLKTAQIREAGDMIQIVFQHAAPVNPSNRWIDGGSVEHLAEALTAMAREEATA